MAFNVVIPNKYIEMIWSLHIGTRTSAVLQAA
jgi:hypothetical protein